MRMLACAREPAVKSSRFFESAESRMNQGFSCCHNSSRRATRDARSGEIFSAMRALSSSSRRFTVVQNFFHGRAPKECTKTKLRSSGANQCQVIRAATSPQCTANVFPQPPVSVRVRQIRSRRRHARRNRASLCGVRVVSRSAVCVIGATRQRLAIAKVVRLAICCHHDGLRGAIAPGK